MDYNYSLPDCYIYLYHTDEYFILPQYPERVADSLNSTFTSQNALARTAPVFAYANSGPRTVQISLDLHRDMMNSVNVTNSNVKLNQGNGSTDVITKITDDYVDILIKKLQSIALPRYEDADSKVNPPRVAIRLGEEVFIKGVVASGGVSVEYKLPLLSNGKYAQVSISFTVSETQPYDADSVGRLGSFRGLTSGLRTKMGYTRSGSANINNSPSGPRIDRTFAR